MLHEGVRVCAVAREPRDTMHALLSKGVRMRAVARKRRKVVFAFRLGLGLL